MTTQTDVTTTSSTTTTTSSQEPEMTKEEALLRQQKRVVRIMQGGFFGFLFIFQGVTQIYVTHYYLLDFAFVNYSWVTRSALRLWAWHVCLVGVVNWLCLLTTRDDYDPAKHQPESSPPPDLINNQHQNSLATNNTSTTSNSEGNNVDSSAATTTATSASGGHDGSGGETRLPGQESGGGEDKGKPLQWNYCKLCQRATPPRVRHCKKCDRCVVRRDHHCHFVGFCIGHRNQRYFTVLASYGIVVTYIGSYMTLTYLYHHHPEGSSLFNYFLPVTFCQAYAGNVTGFQALLTYHAYMLLAFCPLTLCYFLSEISIILQGKTMHEVMKKRKLVKVDSGLAERLRVPFGDPWWLNFLFPTVFLLPHKHNGMDFPEVTMLDSLPSSSASSSEKDKKED